MRNILISIAFATLTLTACKKDKGIKPKNILASPGTTIKVAQDTIPDSAALKIKLAKDSVNSDETVIMFDHTANANYSSLYDALYFPGFGKVHLSSISSDGRNVAIYALPYKAGMLISLNVNTNTDGNYSLALNYQKQMPKNLHVWIRDTYMKDSADVSSGSYGFQVFKADTGSFGAKRFSLMFKRMQPKNSP